MYKKILYIPTKLRGEVLDCLHSAHQGEANMKSAARLRFFGQGWMWPWVRSAVSAGLAMIWPHPKAEGKPSLPWYLTICVDFFSHEGRNFGAMCDWYLVFLSIQKPMAMQTLHTVWGPRCYHFDWWGTSVKCSSLEELPGKVGYHLLLKFGYVPREQLKSQGGQETLPWRRCGLPKISTMNLAWPRSRWR